MTTKKSDKATDELTDKREVISMLVSGEEMTLFMADGTMMKINDDTDYDQEGIIEYLTPKLTGTSTVTIDLADFASMSFELEQLSLVTKLNGGINTKVDGFEDQARIVTTVIDGETVEGVFFAKTPTVAIEITDTDSGEKTAVALPDVSSLDRQIERAAEDQSPSVLNFLKRLAPVIKDRSHSAEDLLQFMRNMRLPITEDGSLICYKKVRSTPNKEIFVDCHTGKVTQRIGSRVTMPVDMVDPSRHKSCSTGMHVANLGYMKSFSGDTVLMLKVAPENFIAVPVGEHDKARVCSYDIIGIVTGSARKKVMQSVQPGAEDTDFEQMIANIINGNIDEPIEEVMVGKNQKITVKPLNGKTKSEPVKKPTKKKPTKKASGKPLAPAKAKASPKPSSKIKVEKKTSTSPTKKVSKAKAAKAKTTAPETRKLSIPEQAKELFQAWQQGDAMSFGKLLDFKKKKKKSWSALGFSQTAIKKIEKQIKSQ